MRTAPETEIPGREALVAEEESSELVTMEKKGSRTARASDQPVTCMQLVPFRVSRHTRRPGCHACFEFGIGG